jgi:beta-alanine--pyruvate transaminase
MAEYWADAVHSLKGLPHVIDIRTIGLIAGIELAPIAGKPGARAFAAFKQAFADGILIRTTGDIIACRHRWCWRKNTSMNCLES